METILENWIEDMPSQFHDKAKIEAIVSAFSKQMEEIKKVYDDIDNLTDIDTAMGKNLDGVGTIVDLSRKNAYVILRKAKDTVIDDEIYRTVLRYKLLQNTSECTYYDIIESIHMLWDAKSIHYSEYWGKTLNGSKLLDGTNTFNGLTPATIHIEVDDASLDGHDSLLGRAIALKPAGVHMTYVCGYNGFFDMSEVEDFDCPTIDNHIGIGFMQVGKYLDGSKLLDGKNILDGYSAIGMGAELTHKGWGVSHTPPSPNGSKLLDGNGGMDFNSETTSHGVFIQNDEKIGIIAKTDLGISFWKAGYFTGDDVLGGSLLRDSKIGHTEQRVNHFISLQDDDGTMDSLTIETHNRNYAFLTGWKNLDGTRMLNSIYRKEKVQ